jgi:hypothetical protein
MPQQMIHQTSKDLPSVHVDPGHRQQQPQKQRQTQLLLACTSIGIMVAIVAATWTTMTVTVHCVMDFNYIKSLNGLPSAIRGTTISNQRPMIFIAYNVTGSI